jgi:BirA family biotin operon repressor/biotin-[acetyl-CoA-carboxylase] ligase
VLRPVGHLHVQRVAVRIGVHRNRGDPHLAARADHPHGDLAAVGDQDPGFAHNRLVVEAVKGLGQDSLRRAVLAAGIDVEPTWLDETASTNDDALRLAEAGAHEWTVVAAGHQTAGRGRLGRSWSDVPGASLLASVLLRPALDPEKAPLLTLLAAVAMVEACGLPAMASKWPNDLIVGDRKVGGILAEAATAEGAMRHVVIGTGLNIAASGLPGDLTSTSVRAEGGEADAEGILARYLRALKAEYDHHDFPSRVVARYASVCSTLGRRVRATSLGGIVVEGLAKDLGDRGSLLVETAEGTHPVAFGEIVHLRAT